MLNNRSGKLCLRAGHPFTALSNFGKVTKVYRVSIKTAVTYKNFQDILFQLLLSRHLTFDPFTTLRICSMASWTLASVLEVYLFVVTAGSGFIYARPLFGAAWTSTVLS